MQNEYNSVMDLAYDIQGRVCKEMCASASRQRVETRIN